jgi:hypothetical protein
MYLVLFDASDDKVRAGKCKDKLGLILFSALVQVGEVLSLVHGEKIAVEEGAGLGDHSRIRTLYKLAEHSTMYGSLQDAIVTKLALKGL